VGLLEASYLFIGGILLVYWWHRTCFLRNNLKIQNLLCTIL